MPARPRCSAVARRSSKSDSPGGGVVRAFVDPERMFIMRWAGDGEGGGQSYSSEVTALDYDTEIDASRFTFDPPPGAREVEACRRPSHAAAPACRSAERPSPPSPASSDPRTRRPATTPASAGSEGSANGGCGPVAVWALLEAPDGGYILLRQRLRPGGVPRAARSWQPVDSGLDEAYRYSEGGVLSLLWRDGDVVALLESASVSFEELLRIAESSEPRTTCALMHGRGAASVLLRSEASRRGRAPAPHSGRVLVHSSSARQRQLLLRRCGDWTRCGTMRRKEPDALAAWASGVRVPWSADWRADASCEGGTDDIRGEGCDRHEPRPSLDALRAFRGRGAGPLQGVRRGARIPRESFQPVLAGAGQETPDGSPELASPRTPGTRRRRHGSRVPSPNRGASRASFLLPAGTAPSPWTGACCTSGFFSVGCSPLDFLRTADTHCTQDPHPCRSCIPLPSFRRPPSSGGLIPAKAGIQARQPIASHPSPA